MNKKITNDNQHFQTSDIALCSALHCYGIYEEFIDKNDPSKVVFYIKKNKELEELIKNYWLHQLKIDPIQYFNCLKEIKTRIYGKG